MIKRFILLAVSVFLTVLASPVLSQELPSFKDDGRIVKGQFPNGINYYLVRNTVSKGYADFALVQKNNGAGSREILSRLGGARDIKPYKFLADKGIGYSVDGYASSRGGSSVFSFRNVPTFDASAADSTLLVIFDMIRTVSCPQAVIISGDVDVNKLVDRMYVLSMTIPLLPSVQQASGYEWTPGLELICRTHPSGNPGVSRITVTISSPRVAPEYMNTPQPLVTEMFLAELQTILSQRIRKAFREKDIALGGISIVHEGSSVKEGDETYSISLTTDGRSVRGAVETLSSVLGSIDGSGVEAEEYLQARDRIILDLSSADPVQSNGTFVDRCVNSYLYGATLASAEDINRFMTRRRLPAERELELFNSFSSALLDTEKAIEMDCSLPEGVESGTSLKAAFRESWGKPSPSGAYSLSDTTFLADLKAKTKLKVKSSVPDPITGGQVWTFSNGMKVIYKKADTKGRFEYGLMIKGGTPNVPGLRDGEAGFVPDMLGTFDVAGMKPEEFRWLLSANGITMDWDVSVSDFRIRGTAPSSKVQFLLKSLLTLSKSRTCDRGEFDYYSKCEEVRLSARGLDVDSELEGMREPGYRYSEVKASGVLESSLQVRAGGYFDSQFSRMNDGVLVFIGDLDEQEFQKILEKSLGNFDCGKAMQTRSKVRRDMRQGWYTRSFDGDPCVAVCLSAGDHFSMEGYMTFKVASVALQKEIVKALADEGMYAEFGEAVEFFPAESYSIVVKCRPCDMRGLPSDVREQRLYRTLDAVRGAVNRLSSASIQDSEIKAYKAALKNRMASHYSSPSVLIDAAMTRYSVGRDLVTMYADYIDGVNVSAVRTVLSELNDGDKMEIVVK